MLLHLKTPYACTVLLSLAVVSLYAFGSASQDEINEGDVARTDLAGTWITIPAVNNSPQLALGSKGTFKFQNFPRELSDIPHSGKWQLRSGEQGTEIVLISGETECAGTLYRATPPYRLEFAYGDPDEGRAVDLHRVGDGGESPIHPMRYLRVSIVLAGLGLAFLTFGALIGDLAGELTLRNDPGCFFTVACGGVLLPVMFIATVLLLTPEEQNVGSPLGGIFLVPVGWLIGLLSRKIGQW